jgi:hypothetical protein
MAEEKQTKADLSAEQFNEERVEFYCEDETNGIMFDVIKDEESNIYLFTMLNPNTTEVDTNEGKIELHNIYGTLVLTEEEAIEASKALRTISILYNRMME